MRTLDSVLNGSRINFIKIDVEGAEPLAMKGALEALKRHRPTILSEVHPEMLKRVSRATPQDYVGLLAQAGYRCRTLLEGGKLGTEYSGGSDLINVVFLPDWESISLD